MDDQFKSVSIDDVVASAAQGVLRAFEARKMGEERLTVSHLIQSGFNVKFEIWAGGPFIRQLEGFNPASLPGNGGRLGPSAGNGG